MFKPLSFLLSAAFLTISATAVGESLSPGSALARALAEKGVSLRSRAAADYSLAYSVGGDVYVFSCAGSGGFIAVSGDTDAPAVLGYSDAGVFEESSMPPAMKWWLGEYAAQIKAYGNRGVARNVPQTVYGPIEPMVTTRWNQNSPYNDDCPEIKGTRAVTGCVATAMAQVLRYHKWPEQCAGGVKTYTKDGVKVSFDYSNYAPDWADMPDVALKGNKAVAALMLACGVSVDMHYTANESGAASALVASAMANYFGYDKGVEYMPRQFYSKSQWDALVYNQLKEYGPVQYSGQSNEDGHSFVCDGYSSDGYFHINWGWGGMSDGYFLLTALDPISQGIGGSSSGFDSDQDIIGNVSRPRPGSAVKPKIVMTEGLSIEPASAKLGNSLRVQPWTGNFSVEAFTVRLGLKLISATGAVSYAEASSSVKMNVFNGCERWPVRLPSRLDAGKYTVVPAYKYGDQWYDVAIPVTGCQAYTMTVKGNDVTLSPIVRTSNVEITGLEAQTPVCLGQKAEFSGTISNSGNGEFYGTVTPVLMTDGMIVAQGANVTVDVEGGSEEPFSYTGGFSAGAVEPGTYDFCFVDSNTAEIVSNVISVEVSELEYTITDFKYLGNNPSDLNFSATLTCTSGYFNGPLTLCLANIAGKVLDGGYAGTNALKLDAGESGEVTARLSMPTLSPGIQYMAALFIGNTQACSPIRFKPGDSSDVSLPGAGADVPVLSATVTDGAVSIAGNHIAGVAVYNIAGVRTNTYGAGTAEIDLSANPPGLYLVEITYGSDRSHSIIYRVIRR